MTHRLFARINRSTRFWVTAFAVFVMALMSGDRPAGQIASQTNAVSFLGTAAANQYITFGPATGPNGLNATDFTLELWFRKQGAGVTTTTSAAGGGGLSGGAVPLVAKGRGEADGSNVDLNYFLGLNLSGGVYTLAADFEDMATGGNHAVTSTTPILDNTWYHAAATYNSTTGDFILYLNGAALTGAIQVPATTALTRIPRNDNIQHASIGSALTSAGTAGGYFNGVVDEVRIWNVVRTPVQIAASRYLEVTSGTGLIGRWGFNEGAGTVAMNSVPSRPHGTLTNTPTRVVGNILPVDGVSPSAPQNVTANIGNALVTISWPENPELDLTGYNVYRNGSGTPLNVSPLTSAIFTDNTVANGTSYSYTVRALDTSANLSAPSTAVVATPNALAGAGMQFNGTNQYVTFGPAIGTASGLGAQTFTLETWFKRTGFGVGTSTGTGGFEGTSAIPLITKGRGEAEGSNVDMNYFFGINASTGVLIADFEDSNGSPLGGNHPASGVTPIPISPSTWHHAAATFDGTSWRIYLDGVLESTTSANGGIPRSDSIQHAGIGSAMTSTGAAAGFFNGILEEVRIWDHARTIGQINATMFDAVESAPGLIGRWGLNNASGSVATGSARGIDGTVMNSATWTAGYPYPAQLLPPDAPQGLNADPGNARVVLSWTANSETDLAGYNVYRSTSSPVSVAGSPLNGSTLVTANSYLDLGLTNNTQYFYVVTAVDTFGNTSAPSNEDDATPDASLNQTPIVTAGPDRVIDFGGIAALSGAATDDGAFTVQWTKVSGPGTVNFTNASLAATTATFTQYGTYVLRLTADDGAKSAFDEMTVTANLVLLGAGDVAPDCIPDGSVLTNANATATLLEGMVGPIFTLGDNSYTDGTAAEFATCYTPTWGRPGIKSRTRPVTGNHDYNTLNATGYFDFFNGVGNPNGPAGDRSLGYYSYNVGNWHVVVLNSECPTTPPQAGQNVWLVNGCVPGSDQEKWLRNDLANSPTNNIIAMWHRPRYSSSSDDATHAYTQPLWQALYDYGADIYLGGHWHNYERLGPMNADGDADDDFGIRTFVIGTAGVPVSGSFPNQRDTSEVRNSTAHGVMKFTLHDDSYEWQFFQVQGETPAFTDSGSALVHGAPGGLPPVVDAGADQTIGAGAFELDGIVTDDGPNTVTWSQVSGPGTSVAVFGSTHSAVTSVGFPAAGIYVLQLTANDGLYTRSDTVTVTVTQASGNLPPVVNAGPDQFVTLPNTASLAGTIDDDGAIGFDVTPTWTNQTPAVGTVTFDDPNITTPTATFSAPGTYVLRLTANDGEVSGFDELTVTVNPAEANNAIDFTGTNAYVTFGVAPQLGASKLTLEAWIRRDGAGATADTGSGGFLAVPIVAKGRAQDEATTNNMNYFLGIIPGTPDVLGADFEDNATGLNHPARGLKPVPADGVWHHVAATYDGKDWRLYLDGVLDTTTPVGNQDQFLPRSDSIQHASIGSALNTSGTAEGFFNGVIDEVRVWNRALSQAELQARINSPILNDGNLIGRFGLNESNGTSVANSVIYVPPVNGTINGSGYTRTAGAPFNLTFNQAPNLPVLVAPTNGATGQPASATLSVNVSDHENDPLDVTFFGRPKNPAAGADFNYVAIPDTQHYVDNATWPVTFTQQTQWIVNNRATMNIAFVSHLGDIVEHIDTNTPNSNPPINAPLEWDRASASMQVLDDALMPYGIAPGNHDMSSLGVAAGYDLKFPVSRMLKFSTYGGYLGANLFNFTDPINRQNKNNFSLFSAGGMDFVVIHLEYDMPPDAVAWADRVLKAFPNRRAIIATHLFLSDAGQRPSTVLNRGTDGTSAAAVWTSLIVPNCNVFLILNGHYPGEANRSDATPTNAACPTRTVHQLESDYQSRANGGDGYLRYMTFKPSENKIYVYTYSPKLNQFETDANSQFVLDYNMQGTAFSQIATDSNVTDGTAQVPWPGRAPATEYEWYASVSDGNQSVNGPTWSFVTEVPANLPPTANAQSGLTTPEDTARSITLTGSDPENTALTFAISTAPAHGTVSSGSGAARTYTPAPNYFGTDSFEFTVTDALGATSTPAIVSITVTAVNDPPAADAQSVTTSEDNPLSITLAGTDPEGSALTYTVTQPAAGTGTVSTGTGPTRTYTPPANFNGSTSFTFTVSDGTLTSSSATVSITVTPVNDLPTANAQSVTTAEDNPLSITLAGTDPEGSALTYTVTQPAAGGSVSIGTTAARTFTPAPNFNGPTSFTFTVTDALGGTSAPATVSINVTPVNDAPAATPQSVTTAEDTPLSITLAGTDPEGSALTYTVTQPAAGTGTVSTGTTAARTFTPAPNFSGTTSFTFTVNDGGITSTAATVSINVTPVSDPPTANGQSVATVQSIPVNITLTGSDPDGGAVTFAVQSQPVNGILSGTAPNLTYTPTGAFLGTDSFTFVTNDGTSNSALATVSISVNPAVSFTPLGVGTHFPTVENADQGGGPGPRAITPPAVQLGDLVVIVAAYRDAATLTLAQTGGQVWTSEANTTASGVTVRVFWCQFNGVWTGNPAVTNTTGTSPLTVYSFAVDMAPGTYPEIDVPFLSGAHTGGTVTVPSFNTITPGALALAGWISIDNNTWSAPPAGWSAPGGQVQWRNSNGSDNTIALAYRNMTSAGATGAAARTQTVNGPDAGVYFRMAFKATFLSPPTPPSDPANLQGTPAVGQVNLTWQDNATNEFAFQIDRCAGADCTTFAPLTAVGSNVTSYIDTTVANTTTYKYRVRAVNVLGSSQYSISPNITTPTPPFVFRGVGTHFPTVENADQGAGPGPRAITPPALQIGDLMVIVATYRGTATLTLSETGGQNWTSEANTQANGQTTRVFWTQFNGAWTANPAVTNTTGTSPLTVYSFAFDLAPGMYPDIDVPFAAGNHAGGTVTIPSFNTNSEGTLALAGWISIDNNTWSAPTAGWSMPAGPTQWRNGNGSDNSIALAYRLFGPAGPTGTVARTQSASGPDNGIYFRMAFRALPIPSNPPDDPTGLVATPSVGQVALTWTHNGTNEAGFYVQRCVTVGATPCTNFATIATLGPNVSSYINTGLAGTTTYRYQVLAFNLFSSSNPTNIADATTPEAPPAPPIPFTFRSVGTHFPATDNTNGTGPGPGAVTPPATLQTGDLYVIVASYRGNTTLTLSNTGGQTWTSEANTQGNNVTARVFWTRFNGTWAGNPSVTNTTGTEALTVYSFGFAMSAGTHPEIDVPLTFANHSGGTVTVPSFTTNTAGSLALVGWLSDENNSWSAPTAGWSTPGGQSQWRNTTGEDTSLAFAYRVFPTVGATGTVARGETDGPDVGLYFRLAFKQVSD